MKSMKVDGQDVEEVHKVAAPRRSSTRADGKGPVFSLRDAAPRRPLHRRPSGLSRQGRAARLQETADPIELLRDKLGLSDAEFETLDREVQDLVDASVEFAKAGTDPKPEDALKNVYA
jgi:pyruvate dehydrogenase E1 component alpha subunit